MNQFKYVEVNYDKWCDGSTHLNESYRRTIEDLGVCGYELRGLIPLTMTLNGSYSKVMFVFEQCFDPASAWALSYQHLNYDFKNSEMNIATDCKRPIENYCAQNRAYKLMAYIPLSFDSSGRIEAAELVLMRHM